MECLYPTEEAGGKAGCGGRVGEVEDTAASEDTMVGCGDRTEVSAESYREGATRDTSAASY